MIAAFALLVSVGALALGLVNHSRSRRLDKRDLFLRMHESLIEPSIVAGRRALYDIKTLADAQRVIADENSLTAVYRALASFDVLALYVENEWIDEETVLKEWGNSLSRSIEPARLFIQVRFETIKWHSWPHYRDLAEKAKARPPEE